MFAKKDALHHGNAKPIKRLLDQFLQGDALTVLKNLPSETVDSVITSPPYFHLRDFGAKEQIGLEKTVDEYLERLLLIFDEIKRVLKPAGTCWVNMGDTYSTNTRTGAYYLSVRETNQKFKGKAISVKTNAAMGSKKQIQAGKIDGNNIKTNRFIQSKCLLQIPSRFAIGMTNRGWILRNEIIWHKPNCVPSSVKDRFTADFEKLYFFVKEKKYYFKQQFEPLQNVKRLQHRYFNPQNERKWNFDKSPYLSVNPKSIEKSRKRILELGRNKRSVWRIPTKAFRGNHFAVFPEKLVETPIMAGCPENGIVLDPFMGSGTTAIVAKRLNRRFLGIELNPEYIRLAKQRISQVEVN